MYNESEIIADTVEQLSVLADKNPKYDFEFVLVNDGSRDDTASAAKKVTEGDGRFVVTGYDDNRGKGAAVRFGMLASSGEVRVFTDCDLAYGTDNVVKIADKLVADGTDITIGSRNLSNDG
jgi:dolichyl-phosphate beta-glucosyltransferase